MSTGPRNPHRRMLQLALTIGLATLATRAGAQSFDPAVPPPPPYDAAEEVIQHDLTGPRLGFTVLPDGKVRSLFGWHHENQATSGGGGVALIVERILLLGGIENESVIPSGTLVFGIRSRDGFEVGLGPSISVGPGGFSSAIVVAAGQSYRLGGIRVPVNLAVTLDRNSPSRVSLVTGWAIRESRPARANRGWSGHRLYDDNRASDGWGAFGR